MNGAYHSRKRDVHWMTAGVLGRAIDCDRLRQTTREHDQNRLIRGRNCDMNVRDAKPEKPIGDQSQQHDVRKPG